jgi:hypothetical protein
MTAELAEFLQAIERLMYRAHTLGLVRTRSVLHRALNSGRVEVFEIPPPPPPKLTVRFKVGIPVEQSPPR